jgi:hypothetical protein
MRPGSDQLLSRHPKFESLAAVFVIIKEKHLADIVAEVTEEIYNIGDVMTPL